MTHLNQFPLKRFALLGSLLFAATLWLSIQIALQSARFKLEEEFAELVEKVRAQMTTMQTLHKGLVANMVLQQDTRLKGLGNRDDYVSQVLQEQDNLVFFILPKITSKERDSYIAHKRDEGYTNFNILPTQKKTR